MPVKTIQVPVRGMTCVNCARTVKSTFESFGAREVEVNLSSDIVEVKADSLDWKGLMKELREYGYEPALEEARLLITDVEGPDDASRAMHLLRSLDGVVLAEEGTDGVLRVIFSPLQLERGDIVRAVRRAGFRCRLLSRDEDALSAREDEERRHLRQMKKRMVSSIILSIPLLIAHLGFHISPLIQLMLAAPIQFGPGWYFIVNGWRALRKGNPDMNVLIATGTLSGFFGSLLHFVNPSIFQHVYFETSALIITIVLIGKYLEARAKHMTTSALRRLMSLRPPVAIVERGGSLEEVPVEELAEGDVFVLKAGMRVPSDGRIVEGEGYFDESSIRGEPIPVRKGVGDEIIGGSIMVRGYAKAVAERVGSETLVSQIVKLVREGQFKKARFQSIADRISGVFVQVVVGIAIAVFFLWLALGPSPRLEYALLAAVSVLVVACPCAIGIAIPSVVAVAMGRGASLGMVIRNSSALEKGGEVDTVVFDKTGTLTEGKPVLVSRIPREHLKYLASIESTSDHPVARAIVEAYDGPLLPVEEVRVHEGMGIEGVVGGRRVLIGNPALFRFLSVDVPVSDGLLYFVEGVGSGSLKVRDRIREEAPDVVRMLKSMGLGVYILSGDSEENVREVAGALDVDGYFHSALPQDKVAILEEMRARGLKVAFVGDGINDAAVLSHADLGIAAGGASDIARESGDVILLRDDLRGVVDAIRLCRASLRRIRWNLFWTFAYNVLLIPMAGGVFYLLTGRMFDPVWSAVAMGLSDVSVIGNALLLYRFR